MHLTVMVECVIIVEWYLGKCFASKFVETKACYFGSHSQVI